jgi:hypothetical protein
MYLFQHIDKLDLESSNVMLKFFHITGTITGARTTLFRLTGSTDC